VKRNQMGKNKVPYIATHDGRTIRYPDPDIKARPLLLVRTRDGARALPGLLACAPAAVASARAATTPRMRRGWAWAAAARWQPGAPDRLGEEHARRCEGAHREAEEASAKSAQAGARRGPTRAAAARR